MAATTPVGYLYTPQQLAGSLRYGSGVRLGNWREDDEIDDKRMADYIASKEAGDLFPQDEIPSSPSESSWHRARQVAEHLLR